ncbi:MAG: NAD(P)/FAD-dependent oxidoreductase [Acidimicrobiia bacterium]
MRGARPARASRPAERTGERVVIVGAGIAGLCCARLLAERFDEVLVLDRDDLPDEAVWRRQVPQGQHQHLLLAAGVQLLERWFPGLVEELRARGAVEIDLSRDFYWYRNGGVWRSPPSSIRAPSMSRPLLEAAIRRRVAALPNVVVRDHTPVGGLEVDAAAGRVRGVRLAGDDHIPCDLVVDATGRQARSLRWLEDLGYEPPPSSVVQVDIRYVTQVYERRDHPTRDWKAAFVIGDPDTRRMAAAVPFEGDRWYVLLGGVNGEAAPTEPAAALAYARSFESPVVADVMESSPPIGEPTIFRFPSNRRHHLERLRRFPLGWVPVGDAVCTFNPLYGQGMTCAAQQAQALADQLDRTRTINRSFARRYFRAVRRVVADPWRIAVGGDFAYDGTSGPKPAGTDLMNRYMRRVAIAAQRDATVATRIREVATLVRRPGSLLAPTLAWRVLRSGARGPTGATTLEASDPPTVAREGRFFTVRGLTNARSPIWVRSPGRLLRRRGRPSR